MPTLFQNVNVNTIDGVKQLLNNATLILMWFVGALAVIFIIVGGIQYITSAGNPSGQEKSKKTITYAIGGLILALSTAAIISFIGTVFKI
jgi:surface polysaccharide O-acyltransferase-like enzyme